MSSCLLAPSPSGQRGSGGGSPRSVRGGRGGMDIYGAPREVGGERSRWGGGVGGGAQTGEFINVAPRCQLGAGGAGGRGAGGCAAEASMPPLFDGASGRAASDGRCAPALPAALDHFHAKPRPGHPPSCGPRGGGTAGGWERTGGCGTRGARAGRGSPGGWFKGGQRAGSGRAATAGEGVAGAGVGGGGQGPGGPSP